MRSGRKIKLLLIIACLALVNPAAGQTGKRKPVRAPRAQVTGAPVAIWKLTALGLDKQVVRQIQRSLSEAFKRSPRWRLVSQRKLRARLAKDGLDLRSPIARAAPTSGADFLITGTMAGLGEEVSLDLKLHAGADGAEIRRVSLTLPEQPEARAAALDEGLLRLLSPERWVGGLALEVSEADAQVFLDGQPVARTPLVEPLTGLAPGKHILMIRKEGFGEFSKFVFIRYGQVARLKVDLANATVVGLLYEEEQKKRPPPPEPTLPVAAAAAPAPAGLNWQQITGWTLFGVGAAAAAAAGLLGWHAAELESDVERGWWTPQNEDILADKLDEGRKVTRWSNRMLITGGGLALLSAGFLVWGYLTEPGSPQAGAAGVEVGLAPAALPGGFGLWLSSRF